MAIMKYIISILIFTILILGLWTMDKVPHQIIPYQPTLKSEPKLTHFNDLRNDIYSYLMAGATRPSYCLPIPSERSRSHKDSLLDCSLPYVSIFDGGRLGNQICQYSVLLILREMFGIRVAVREKTNKILSKIFDHLHIPTVDNKCFTQGAKSGNFNKLYRNLLENLKKMNEFVNISSTSSNKILEESYYIEHNPCPAELMWLYRDKMRKELVFKTSIINKAKTKVKDILRSVGTSRENVTLVTVHVRRTDYKEWLKKNYDGELVGELFFKRAFGFYREKLDNPLFLVTSDDPKWCRKHIMDHDVEIPSPSEAEVDFAILSLGDHHIRSSGTFGFTSALLGHGVLAHPVNYSKGFAWQTEIYNCIRGLNTLMPINAGH